MDTSVGPSDWDDASGAMMEDLHRPGTEKEKKISGGINEMEVVEDSITEKNREKEGRGGRRWSMKERGEPHSRAPPPSNTLPPPQPPRRGKTGMWKLRKDWNSLWKN